MRETNITPSGIEVENRRILENLLLYPREDLDVEFKDWPTRVSQSSK